MSRSGYTLPVFACAAAMAALHWLRNHEPVSSVSVDLISPAQTAEISVEQVAGLDTGSALGITISDPGDNLDLTRNTPVWALVTWRWGEGEPVRILGGEGIGKQIKSDHQPAIYGYAQRLLIENLGRMLSGREKITVTIILPEGRSLAVRTSNPAFGVVDGLSLLGTTGISQPLSTPEQLETFRRELQLKASEFESLVFCIGENGLDLGLKIGINPQQMIKTANWLGPMLVTADILGVKEVLLFGYHGKLIKLAAGIFHTHHHLADGRREVLATHCALAGLQLSDITSIFHSPTAEDGLRYLASLDTAHSTNWVERVYGAIAETIDIRSQEYIQSHSTRGSIVTMCGSVLFNRDRKIFVKSKNGCALMEKLC